MAKPKLSVVIPTLNEEKNIELLIKRLANSLQECTSKYELIFVDDHSGDQTVSEINKLKLKFPVKVLLKKGKRGKSFSLLQGFALAQYDLIAMIDADLQYPPEALPLMLRKIIKEQADIVLVRRNTRQTPWSRRLGGQFIIQLFRILFGLSADVQAGEKMFKKEFLTLVNVNRVGRWTLDLELLHSAIINNRSIKSVDIKFYKRIYGKSKVQFFRDGTAIVGHMIKIKLRSLLLHTRDIDHGTWLNQAARFATVGVVNTLIDVGLFLVLTGSVNFFKSHIFTAKVISYAVATVNSFVLNRKYTFSSAAVPLTFFVLFIAVNTVGVGINVFTLYASINYAHFPRLAGLLLATGVAFIWNFLINKFYIFNNKNQTTKSLAKSPARSTTKI